MALLQFLLVFHVTLWGFIEAYNIPPELIYCYRGNYTLPSVGFNQQLLLELIRKIETMNPTTLDMRMLSVQLMHRLRVDGIEKAPGLQESEFLTPYSTRGIMVPKYTLLRQLVSNIPGSVEFDKFLTPLEICLLHRMLSSTVEPYQRGDERTSCPGTISDSGRNPQAPWIMQNKAQLNQTTSTTFSRPISRCPLEGGTYRSFTLGSVSPGIAIMSIAAGLQPQNVRITDFISAYRKKNPYENLESMELVDTRKQLDKLLNSVEAIDNVHAAGLAGDLAEVCLYQGPYLGVDLRVGLRGRWNDTYFPRVRFLADNHDGRWEMTDSEILSGIDGFFLSQQVPSFVNRVRRLRLSQVLDMYYSARGIPIVSIENVRTRKLHSGSGIEMDPKSELREDSLNALFNAAGKTRFRKIFNDGEQHEEAVEADKTVSDEINKACYRKEILRTIDRDRLKRETFNFVQVLQYTTGSVVVEDSLMRRNCDAAVDRFFSYAADLVGSVVGDCNVMGKGDAKPNVDLMLVIDGSRSFYENQQLIFHLAELIDISTFGSYISVIHGMTGEFMVNRTNSLTSVFEQLSSYEGLYPTAHSLSKSFDSIIRCLSARMDEERSYRTVGASSPVIMVVSQSQRVAQNDYESARRMLTGSFEQFPDLYFVFLTNDVGTFSALTDFSDVQHSRQPAEEHYKIIESSAVSPESFSAALLSTLNAIPLRLVAPFCRSASNRDMWRDVNIREEFEQYLSPGEELRYRISRSFLWNTGIVRIQFQNSAYGEFTVCATMDHRFEELSCRTTSPEQDNIWFNFTGLCSGERGLTCSSLYFVVQMESSYLKCTENDCRYPDQVRMVIKHEGLRCPTEENGVEKMTTNWLVLMCVLLIFITNFSS